MATKWTKEKEDIILQEVKNNPEHLRRAFKAAAKRINKTPESVCTRYYNVINKNKGNSVILPEFTPPFCDPEFYANLITTKHE